MILQGIGNEEVCITCDEQPVVGLECPDHLQKRYRRC